MTNLFITGMSRSGTTLLAELIRGLDSAEILLQPFPFFFRFAKKKFFDSINYPSTYYVLNNYFFEDNYILNDFLVFLDKLKLTKTDIATIFAEMSSYSGKYTDILFEESKLEQQFYSFSDFFKAMLQNDWASSQTTILGFKEIHCEEFIPYLINKNWKCLMIIRNPYDVLTSIQFGKGSKYTGEKRPTLFHLRNWRKSAAMGILFEKYENFHLLRFEDLILNSEATIHKILSFLEIENHSHSIDLIKKTLSSWNGNSSFETRNLLDKNTINRYKEELPISIKKYISKVCQPEINYYNYELECSGDFNLEDYQEPFDIESADFDQNFSHSFQNIQQENLRLDLLSNKGNNKELIKSIFIDDYVFEKLKK